MNVLDEFELGLSGCNAGDEGEITEVTADSGAATRLRELGLMPGRRVRVLRAGSPMILMVNGTRLCVRGAEADAIRVRLSYPATFAGEARAVLNEG